MVIHGITFCNIHCICFCHFFSDINECESNPCHNQGTCRDEVNGHSCKCPQGYTGITCDKGIVKPINMACVNTDASGRMSNCWCKGTRIIKVLIPS